MERNLKHFLIKAAGLIAVIVGIRALFQFPIDYYQLDMLAQTEANRLFSKIDALKVLSVVAVFFALYYRERISALAHPGIRRLQSAAFFGLGFLSIVAYYGIRYATNHYAIDSGPLLYAVRTGVLLSLAIAWLCLSIAVFQKSYLRTFISKFRNELYSTAIASVALYVLLMLFQGQWHLFSGSVAFLLNAILTVFYPTLYYVRNSTPILQIDDFSVSIGSPCSGIDSMFLFIAFFAGLYALDRHRMRKGPFWIAFCVGLVGVYFVNVLRLLFLIVIGVEISPRFAVGMFHTNAGWLFFVVYFLCYYLLMKKFIYQPGIPQKS